MMESIVLGGGCFWCVEAVLSLLNGVTKVTSGYAGGHRKNPNYENVSLGLSGHAEVVKIEFDPTKIELKQILAVFFTSHNPTTLNQQGADRGTQYRSIVLYSNEEQKKVIEDFIKYLEDEKIYADPIVTELKSLEEFYPGEDYHQDYYSRNSAQPYCQVVINPKINKVKALYKDLLRK